MEENPPEEPTEVPAGLVWIGKAAVEDDKSTEPCHQGKDGGGKDKNSCRPNSDSIEPYIYRPLLPEPNSIRLIRLHPSPHADAPIECSIIDYCLSARKHYNHLYDCLSYVWGSTEHRKRIFIDGAWLDVTRNLYAVLLQLRDPYLERVIWIDAICIDQENLAERSEQVQFMAMIYAYARQVVVWLGVAADGSDEAMDWIDRKSAYHFQKITNRLHEKELDDKKCRVGQSRSMDNRVERENSHICEAKQKNETDPYHVHLSPIEEAGYSNLRNLFQRSWFNRVWVLQELAAAQDVVFLCGDRGLSGTLFREGLSVYNHVRSSSKGPAGSSDMLFSICLLLAKRTWLRDRNCQIGSEFRLDIASHAELVDMFRLREATDPRDKIYAMIGMSSATPNKPQIHVDYSRSWPSTFRSFVQQTLSTKVRTGIACYKGKKIPYLSGQVWVIGLATSVYVDFEGCQCVSGRKLIHPLDHMYNYSDAGPGGRMMQWKINTTAVPIIPNDIFCLFDGADNATVLRRNADHFTFTVIAIEVKPTSKINFERYIPSHTLNYRAHTPLYKRELGSDPSWSAVQDLSTTHSILALWPLDKSLVNMTGGINFKLWEMEDIEMYDPVSLLLDMAGIFEQLDEFDGLERVMSTIHAVQRDKPSNLSLRQTQHLRLLQALLDYSPTDHNLCIYKCLIVGALYQFLGVKARIDIINLKEKLESNPKFAALLLGSHINAHNRREHWDTLILELCWGSLMNGFLDNTFFLYGHDIDLIDQVKMVRNLVYFTLEGQPGAIKVLQRAFETMRNENWLPLYQLLYCAIEGDEKHLRWRNAELGAIFHPIAVGFLSETGRNDAFWEFAALHRPFDMVLPFLCTQYGIPDAKIWLEKRPEDIKYTPEMYARLQSSKKLPFYGKPNLELACEQDSTAFLECLVCYEDSRFFGDDERNSVLQAFDTAAMKGHLACIELLLSFATRKVLLSGRRSWPDFMPLVKFRLERQEADCPDKDAILELIHDPKWVRLRKGGRPVYV